MQANSTVTVLSPSTSGSVRLRTVILLRWAAISGQIAAIAVGVRFFQLQLEIGLCTLAIGASVLANLVAIFLYPENRRLSEQEMTAMMAFDIAQLSALLYLTGGLNNPFALLVLAPVSVCATSLRPPSILLTAGLAIILTSVLMYYHMPLTTAPGWTYSMPDTLMVGFWCAIVIGSVFLAVFNHSVSSEIESMSRALLATQMALGREQKLTDLAGVVAATAHELGTPLATIKLASGELAADLHDRPDQKADAELISAQADRCRDILRSMGRAGKTDLHLEQAPFSAIVQDAAEPHLDRGKRVHIDVISGGGEPEVTRQPEIIHGLRNLIQNAVDFARSTVWAEMEWSETAITLRVVDDGPGYPVSMLGRIGDPFFGTRRRNQDQNLRPEYEGMGLGLFIAKTLLERTGAELIFANARDPFENPGQPGEKTGAIVEVIWPRKLLEPEKRGSRRALGENPPIKT